MDKITDDKCTLRKFIKGIKPVYARWWLHNKYGIEALVVVIACIASSALAVCLLTCVILLLVGEGTNTTDFVGYGVLITVICLAVYFTIRRLIQAVKWCCAVVKSCCAAGEDV